MVILLVAGLFFFSLVFAAQQQQQQLALVQQSFTASSESSTPTPDLSTKDYDLLDIILVASVDGKFHALNRTSGATLWSMSSFATTTSVSAPSSLAPLVRTQHVEQNPETDDINDTPLETYIIEPQSGDIYVMSTPSSPLQRFPFSMSELVEISPFTSETEHEHGERYFIGRKETSLILMELETGKIKATLNSECPFIPDFGDEDSQDVDLDELEGSKPLISAPTEIYIGRTDYHIQIHKKPTLTVPNPPIHNLSFSTYGPNNRDNHLQELYRKTNDNSYVQSLPNGEIIAFQGRTPGKEKDGPDSPLWGQHFNAPIVAIFDILQAPPSINAPYPRPFALLQPRPRLPDLFPSRSLSPQHLPNLKAAYVGLVEETDSLFAMSPEGFPLVVFGGSEARDKTATKRDRDRDRKTLPAREGKQEKKVPHERIIDPHDSMCMLNPYDVRCIVGVRQVEGVDEPDGRLKRLSDGPPAPRLKGPAPIPTVVVGVGRTPEDNNDDERWYNENTSGNINTNRPGDILTISDGRLNVLSRLSHRSKLEVFLFTVLFGIFSAWFLWKRVANGGEKAGKRGSVVEVVDHGPENPVVEETHLQRDHLLNDTSINLLDNRMTVHPTISSPPPPVIMNGHADPINDITNTPIPISQSRPLSPNHNRQSSIPLPATSNPNPPPPISRRSTPLLSQIPLPSAAGVVDDNEDSDAEGEAENGAGAAATPGKRKTRRGKRGKKKKPTILGGEEVGNGVNGSDEKDKAEKEKLADKDLEGGGEKPSSLILTTSSPKPPALSTPSLTVSDTVLGYGSHGTVVYQGSFQGRAVAVKRLLQDFVTLATREVSILQQSDDHPNVIRYYYQESHLNFFYIALELCPASLADIIENPHGGNGGLSGSGRREEEWKEIVRGFDAKRAMRQVASGLRHLHGLGLIHRDIKPQNILISSSSSSGGRGGTGYRMLISDFGLCKKLDVDQTSFLPTVNGATGTVGWRAPEILRGDVKLDELSTGDDSTSSRGSVATINSGTPTTTTTKTRLTKGVDIFALGCLFYYTLTVGGHPYGDRFEREVNIIKDNKELSLLSEFCSTEESTEAQDLISSMLHPQPYQRPDTKTCLLHPFFWDPAKRLGFLQDASDRFEVMCREPKDAVLIRLEKDAGGVVGNDWHQRLERIVIENLGKYRKYDGKSVQDLMRALRNKKHHYQDLPDNVKRHLGPMPEGFLGYFTRRYPRLFMHVHGVVKDTGLHGESMFRTYFELPEP